MPSRKADPMANTSFVVYVDEAGDEGFSFDSGSSSWFILSAVVTRKATDLETVKVVDIVRQRLGKAPKMPLHFKKLKHQHRLPYIGEIAKSRIRTVSVLVHKPSIKEPETFQERYRLYFYTVRFLLERVSWLCRDHRTKNDTGDGSAKVVFSNRSGMSYQEMKDYLDRLQRSAEAKDVRIVWDVIKTDQISPYPAGKRMGLQIADAVASGTFLAVEPSRHGYTEDRYVRMLKPVIYHREGTYSGYGLKFWPREVEDLVKDAEHLDWFRSEFQ